MTEKKVALKETQGKVPLELLDPHFLHEVANVFEFGAQKYDRWDWLGGIPFSKIQGAMLRHLTAWMNGEDVAEDSGLSHLAHLAANCQMLLRWIHDNRTDLDDRVFKRQPKVD